VILTLPEEDPIMTRHPLPAPPDDRPNFRTRLVDGIWVRLARHDAYPIRNYTVTCTPTEFANLRTNPNTLHYHNPIRLDDGRWRVQVTSIDRAHPIPTPLRRRWNNVRPAVRQATAIAAIIATLFAAGAVAFHLWADVIAHALTLIAGAAVTALVVLSWWNSHGRNGCTGLHCAGCKGGH
jgi:hypothetical protein